MIKETFETIKQLRSDGKKWSEIYESFNLNFKSIQAMKKSYDREQVMRRSQ